MRPDFSFERQLDNLYKESSVITQYVYTEMAVQHAASQSKKLENRLNVTPLFWNTCQAALQSAAYIAIARVFDSKNSRYNLDALMTAMEKNLTLFGREALAARKRSGSSKDPDWLEGYLNKAYYPNKTDVTRLRKYIKQYDDIYNRAFMKVRHQYLAHRTSQNPNELFAKGKLRELWKLSTFLLQLHLSLQELLHNGRKPVLRPIRYSPRVIYNSSHQRTDIHEHAVANVKVLMTLIESANEWRKKS